VIRQNSQQASVNLLPSRIEDLSKPHSTRPPRGLVQHIVSETLRGKAPSYSQICA
jgi:hypothetical protein